MTSFIKKIHHSGTVQFALKLAVTLGVLWLVFRPMDWAGMGDIVRAQDHAILLIAILLSIIQIFIGTLRWYMIIGALHPQQEPVIPKNELLKIYYISTFFSCCLPGAVGGDVVRVWLAKARHLPLPVCINSVIIDRMMALLALVLMVLGTLPMLAALAGFDAGALVPVAVAGGVFGVWFVFKADWLLGRFSHIRLIHWLLHLLASIRMLLKTPRAFLGALLLALAAQILYAFTAWQLAGSLSVDMTLMQSITLIPPVLLATMLPISIGGWGVREMGIVGMLGLIGVAKASALILSLELGFIAVLVSVPASVLWLAQRRKYRHER